MAMIVEQLITRAFYLTGDFSPETTPRPSDLTEGLFLLNDMLSSFSANNLLVPYQQKLTFTLTAGKGVYTFSKEAGADVFSNKLAGLVDVNVIRNGSAYPVQIVESQQIYESYRYLTTQSIPQYVFLQNAADVTTLEFYPIPDLADTCLLVGKFTLTDLELEDTLDELPGYYTRFLRYELARELCSIYETGNWTQTKEDTYQQLRSNVITSNDIDVSTRLSRRRGIIGIWGPG